LAIARLIQEEVDRQLYDPAAVRRQLEEIDRARRDNELPPEEAAEAERKVVGRLTASQGG
jgi:hypothetical protein